MRSELSGRTYAGLVAALVLVGSGLSGCVSMLTIESLEPGRVNLGAARSMVILAGEGRRSARETVYNQLISEARRTGYFTVTDRSEDGIQVTVAGRSATASGGGFVPNPSEVYLRIDVIEWDARRDTSTTRDAQGRSTTTTVTTAKVLLAITAFDAQGMAPLAETEFEGTMQSSNPNDPEEMLLEQAAAVAIGRFLGEVTPRRVARRVQLDDSEEAMKPIIDVAVAGNLARAADEFLAYSSANPNSAAAAYNLAVVLDAMGRYSEAMVWYDRALQLGNKSFYSSARASCAARMASAQALSR
jgi:hypothetical protein